VSYLKLKTGRNDPPITNAAAIRTYSRVCGARTLLYEIISKIGGSARDYLSGSFSVQRCLKLLLEKSGEIGRYRNPQQFMMPFQTQRFDFVDKLGQSFKTDVGAGCQRRQQTMSTRGPTAIVTGTSRIPAN
jgi:hypothetical protein